MSPEPLSSRAGLVALATFAALAPLSLPLPVQAQTEVDAMRRCRALADAMQRVACYDAIALPSVSAAGAAPPAAAPARPASPPPAAAVVAAAPTAAPAAGPAPDRAPSFGLPMPPARTTEPEYVDSRITGRVEGWTPATRFTLANGQVWEIADGSQAVYDLQDPAVRITRGLFGSFFIRIDGVSQTPRVRRVR